MGSKLGKSTLVPTRIGNTWGVNVLFFWTILATASEGAGPGDPASGSSHTTTPEKSICLRTAASLESRSSTRPDTDPPTSVVAPARLRNSPHRAGAARQTSESPRELRRVRLRCAGELLEEVCKRQVIMRIDYGTRS